MDKQTEQDFWHTFNTQSGKNVLKELEKRFTDYPGIPGGEGLHAAMSIAHQRGTCDVIRYINEVINRGEANDGNKRSTKRKSK